MAFVSVTMTVWTSAWLSGAVAADDVLDALQPWGELHEVVAADDDTALALDLPEPDARPVSAAMLLATLRRGGARAARLALPAPGDVRGIGSASTPFGAAALRCGQAVVLPDAELGVVPVRIADGILRWTVFRVGRAVPVVDPGLQLGIAEAEHGLRGAVREAAAALSAMDIARHRPEVRKEIADALAARPRLHWPAGTPGRALRVLQQADEVAAILAAAQSEDGAAVSSSQLAARAEALRPLTTGVRSARLAAVAEAVRCLTERTAGHH